MGVLFDLVGDILREAGVTLALSCNVIGLESHADGTAGFGKLRVVTGSGCAYGSRLYNSVVVAAAAASVPLLAEADPKLGNHLVGIIGYGLTGSRGSPKVPSIQ